MRTEIHIFSPIIRGRKGEYYQLLYDLLGKGFSQIRLDGVIKILESKSLFPRIKLILLIYWLIILQYMNLETM